MLTASAGTKSKLAKPIQDLIKMIFDVESMKKAMVEFEVGFALLAQIRRVESIFRVSCSVSSIRNLIHAFFSFCSTSDRPPEDAPWKTEQEADSECLCSSHRSPAGRQPVTTLFCFSFSFKDSGMQSWLFLPSQAVSDALPDSHILDLSNRFYTLIPHDFGMKKPPLLNNLDYIQVGGCKLQSATLPTVTYRIITKQYLMSKRREP